MQDNIKPLPADELTYDAGYMAYKPTRRQRLLKWLGFDRDVDLSYPEDIAVTLPCGVAGVIVTSLDIRDRVRVLMTGKVRIDLRHQCENDPGKVWTRAQVSVRWDDDQPT